jgi:PilZ domain-containing protein
VTFGVFWHQLNLLFVATSAYPLRRREPRYDLRLPVSVSLRSNVPGEFMAVSENISAHGILLSTETAIPEGSNIKLLVALRSPTPSRNTYLTAAGRVLRLERRGSGGFIMAVCCDERPFQATRYGSPKL